ncbi:SLAM family member 5 [Xenopus laevis]|uniref:SLAM family member 5 n=2 Tax=Xenopus laevis TaxID=8355 RepID=A0A1L8FC34_XENLA|nr:SLAM family member 5 [Xenopus laevis]XP_041428516.1 SLAM family member 5 [Xenopus laevis]OCT69153.1 hypothetical protein XELAEV_18040462mg [Xenopus laevis]
MYLPSTVLFLCLIHVTETPPVIDNKVGVKGRSISFAIKPNQPDCPPDEITIRWKSRNNLEEIEVGSCKKDQVCETSSSFQNRIEYIRESNITISDLRMEDSGLYTLSYLFTCTERKEESLHNLIVYESVPIPYIKDEKNCSSIGQYNITLSCLVLGIFLVSFHWQKGNSKTGYQHCGNESTIQVAQQCELSLDEEYVCTLYNLED